MAFKHHINAHHETGRDTLCQALRRMYRRAKETGDTELMHEIEKSYDFAKRMDARMKYYKHKYEPWRKGKPELAEGHPDGDDPL